MPARAACAEHERGTLRRTWELRVVEGCGSKNRWSGIEDEMTGAFQERLGLSEWRARVFWEKRDAQWPSLDRPRSYPAPSSFESPNVCSLCPSLPPSSTLKFSPAKPTLFFLCVPSAEATHQQNGCHSGSRPRRACRDQALQVRHW